MWTSEVECLKCFPFMKFGTLFYCRKKSVIQVFDYLVPPNQKFKEICQRKSGRLPGHILSELEAALKCMHSSVVNDRLLSTFELSISGIVEALLAFLKFVQGDTDCEVAVIFRKVNIFMYSFFKCYFIS